jgi:DNA-binding MarR family transcriptional regulator
MLPDKLDKIIHERVRLGIMTHLATKGKATFIFLKKTLELSDGNVNAHMKVLEQNKYVNVSKEFVNKKPRTTYKITPKGRIAFQNYINTMEEFLKSIVTPK